ncbi:MAG: sn-glycerol-3-phosphate ABC transporter ATP-binding protein UgpC, partial [Chromatiales bacterium]
MAEIELKGVCKRFSGTTAVKAASFTIGDGEFFILVGPSGCGKSTLLNMIVGLEDVTEGEVRVNGVVVNDLDPKDRNMAMVFQSYAIYPHMTVRENMAFPLKLARTPAAEIDERVGQAAKILELDGLLDRRPAALSGGQRQRVAMGRAIVREPEVFLLDEPLSNLDAKLRVQMRTEIARLQRRLGTTTVYVTHDQTEAMTLGDRIAVLRRGEVLQIGTPRELYEHPRTLFVAGFIGSPAMNFLPARWRDGRLALPPGVVEPPEGLRQRLESTGGPLVAGFRPDHLEYLGDERRPEQALVFEARAEVVEWLGGDLFVYFDAALEDFAELSLPQDLEIEAGSEGRRSLVARIDPSAEIREGDRIRLGLDLRHVQLFDA